MSDANRHGRKETEPMPNVDKSTPQAICGAKTRSGAPCTQKPMRGQKRCRMHGGSSPNALAAAERRLAALDAARQVQAWGGRLDVTPPEALLELVQTKAAEVAYWQWRVADLSDAERAGLLVAKTERGREKGKFTDLVTEQAAPHVWLVMLHKAQDQLAAYSAAAIKAGVDQRMVELAAMQAAWQLPLLLRVVEAARLDLSSTAADVVRGVLEVEAAR